MTKGAKIMEGENTLFAFEKDIESRGFWDWMRAHKGVTVHVVGAGNRMKRGN